MKFEYCFKVNMGQDQTGKTIYQWAVGDTEEQFFTSMGRLYVEREGYRPLEKTLKPEPHIPSFDEYSAKWYDTYVTIKPGNTQRVYMSELKIWKAALGDKLITAITPSDVQRVLSQHEDRKKRYLDDVLNILSQILDMAVEDGYVTRNVVKSKRVINPGRYSKERRILTDEELGHCINKLSEMESRDDKLFAAISIYTGMRPGEVLGLAWDDIDFDNSCIHIRRGVASHGPKGVIGGTKTKNGLRRIGMQPALANILKPYRGIGLIFTCNGEPYGQYQREQMRDRIEKYMNIGHIVPYTFRHTFATKAYEAGSKVKSLSEWMGHSEVATTMKYYIHNTDKMRNETGTIVNAEFEKLAANLGN